MEFCKLLIAEHSVTTSGPGRWGVSKSAMQTLPMGHQILNGGIIPAHCWQGPAILQASGGKGQSFIHRCTSGRVVDASPNIIIDGIPYM
jgi:hypothetical protein